jgi:hypothetical protein
MVDGVIRINTLKEAEIEEDASVEKLDRVAPEYHKGGENEFEKYNGVKLDETGNLTDDDFFNELKRILKIKDIEVLSQMDKKNQIKHYKALPDDADTFKNTFIDLEKADIKNENLFKKRILGLSSYFRSAQEKLLPSFVKDEHDKTYHVVPIEMSEHQFAEYVKIRKTEIEQEKQNQKQNKKHANREEEDPYKISSTYRIFSRAACNFTFPEGIQRPMPDRKSDMEEGMVDPLSPEQIVQDNEYMSDEDIEELKKTVEEPINYQKRIRAALDAMEYNPKKPEENSYLTKARLGVYSPKFLKIMENISDKENKGLHLLYSQFRTIEGIGILKLILEANNFAEFKIKKNTSNEWVVVNTEEDNGKPCFVLYTGTEGEEEKEIIRNIYNSNWDLVPITITEKLKEKSSNNLYGEIIKLMMITSSGAEGINLKNTRFVHIVEPYWHMVRSEQVIGRARRICSHQDLPEELRTVKVFMYISVFSEKQKTDKQNIEIMVHDLSRRDGKPVTTDQSLYEMADIKNEINQKILKSIKETSIDCSIYNKNSSSGEQLVCYGSNLAKSTSNNFLSYPTLEQDQAEKEDLNVKQMKYKKIEIEGVKYFTDQYEQNAYDYNRLKMNNDVHIVGKLTKDGKNFKIQLRR